MGKQKVLVQKSDAFKINKLEINDGNRKVTLTYYYDADGFISMIDLQGRKKLPLPNLVELINRKWIDRIGTINLINEISKISKIDDVRASVPSITMRPLLKAEDITDYVLQGVGTPVIVQSQKSSLMYLLFTGWNTTDGTEREVFIANIDSEFTLSNVRRLIASSFPNATYLSHSDIDCVYDPFNDQWVVLTSSGNYATPLWRVGLWRFSEDFETRESYSLPLNITPEGGAPVAWVVDDHAPNLLQMGVESDKIAHVFYTNGGIPYWGWTTDFDSAVPTFTYQTTPILNPTDGDNYSNRYITFDIGTIMMTKYGLVALVEALDAHYYYRVYPLYIEKFPDSSVAGRTTRHALGGLGTNTIIPAHSRYAGHQSGHPHLNFLPDGNLNLFFSFFKVNPPDFTHEIWYTRFDVEDLDPLKQRAIIFVPWFFTTIVANDTTLPFTGIGGDVSIYFASSAVGDLTVEASMIGSNNWYTLSTYAAVTSKWIKVSQLARALRLKFSANATVYAYVVINPR